MSFATPEMSGIGQSNEFSSAAQTRPFSQASEIRFSSAAKNDILAHGGMGATFSTGSGNTNVEFHAEPPSTSTALTTSTHTSRQFASQMANDFLNNLKTSELSNEVNTEHLHFGLLDHQKHIKNMHFGLKHHTEALNHLHELHTAQNSENKVFHSALENHAEGLGHLKSVTGEFHSGLKNHMDALNHLNEKQIEFGQKLEAISSKLDSLALNTSSKHDEVTQCFGALNDVLQTHANNITELKSQSLRTSSNNPKKKVIA